MVILLISTTLPAYAGSFTSAMIRPGSHTIATSPLPILFSVNTASASTEDSFRITIPTGYQYSNTAGSYTVSTALIPDGYQAWPSISTATSVSGNQITFPSGDLQAGVTYAFYLTGGITTNPPVVSGAESVWQVETLSAGSQVDISNLSVPVKNNSSVNVSATVPTASSYYHVGLNSSVTGQQSQLETANYTLSYRTDTITDTDITVQATWTQGTIDGTVTPSVDVAEYVAGSASTAFGGAEPIIDPVARTITWNITSLAAADGEQTVAFSLSTTQNFKGSETVTYDVSVAITDPAVSLPATITETYKYLSPPSSGGGSQPTPTATPSESTSTSPTPSPIPSSSPSPVPAEVVNVLIPTVSDTSITITVQLSTPNQVELFYGTEVNNLSKKLTSLETSDTHTIVLTGLEAGTRYYFRFRTTGSNGTSITSDIYSLETSTQPLIGTDLATSSFYFSGIPLSSNADNDQIGSLILPVNQSYQLVVRFPEDVLLKSFRVSVLYNEIQSIGSAYQVPFINIGNNTYVVTINALSPEGRYTVMYDIEDYLGNKQSITAGTIKVVKAMTILDAESKDPVENVLVELERYNEQLSVYELLDLQSFSDIKEWRSDQTGILKIALPHGKYRFTVSAPSYKKQTFEYEIGEQTDEYPQVLLDRENLFLLGRIKYFYHSLNTVRENLNPILNRIVTSKTIYTIVSFLLMIFLSVGLVVSLSAKTHISVYKLPSYILLRLKNFGIKKNSETILQGKVVSSETLRPISRADIALMDTSNSVIATTTTTSNGYFHILLPSSPSSILVTEPGFLPNTYHVPENPGTDTLLFKLNNKQTFLKAETKVSAVFKFITSSLFEILLLSFCAAQFFFAQHFGLFSVIPFIILSLINLIIWTTFLSNQMLPQQFRELEAVVEK